MKFKRTEESTIVVSQLMLPSHSNFRGKIHGGYILSIMDQVAFACASKHSENYCVTASVNKVDFLNPVEVGDMLILKASINYTGRTSMVVGLRVEAENIQKGIIKHCNSSYFTMVAKDEAGNNIPIPGLVLDSIEDVRRFTRSLTRRHDRKTRSTRFHSEKFVLEDHLHLLEGQNASLSLTNN